MLQGRHHGILRIQPFSLQSLHRLHAHHGDEIRIFTKRLLRTPPARITHYIQHRRIGGRSALAAGLQCHCPAHLPVQLRIPHAAQSQRNRKYGRADRHMSV